MLEQTGAFAQAELTDIDPDSVALTNILQVRQVVARHEGVNRFVRFAGSILWINPSRDQFILQDDSSGIAVKMNLQNYASLQPGQKILVEGNGKITREGIVSMPLIDNDGVHASEEKSESIYFSAGLHPISIEWFNASATFELAVECAGPGMARQPIPDAILLRTQTNSVRQTDEFAQGLNYSCYEGEWWKLPDFSQLWVVKQGVTTNFNLQIRTRDANVGLVFSGFFNAPQDGIYTFWLRSDDGSKLYFGRPLQLTPLSETNFPEARILSPGQFADQELECRWVQAEGVITRVTEIYQGVGIEMASGTARIYLKAVAGNYDSLRKLLRSRVKVTGIYQTAYDTDGQNVSSLLVPDKKNITVVAQDLVHSNDTSISSPANQLPWLTKAIQVKSLSRTEAQRGYPVKIQGVITAHTENNFVIQDSTWSVFCYWDGANGIMPKIGDYWEIEGRSDVVFAPDVIVEHLSYLCPGILPEPIHPTQNELINGSLDTQYIEMQGIATAVETNAMTLLTRDGKMQFNGFELIEPKELEGALVRIRGVCVPNRDTNQMIRPASSPLRLFNTLVNVDEPVSSHPFEIPLKHAADLLFFDAHADVLRRVKLAGQVTIEWHGEYFLMDGDNGFRVELTEPTHLQPGDLVEAVGFPDVNGPSPVLREAVARVIGQADLPKPRRLSENSAISGKLDANPVTITSRLLSMNVERGEEVLELQVGTRNYLARLANTNGILPDILPGSLLELTGVYVAQGAIHESGETVDSFVLLLNSPADIRVLARPSWWTFRHTLTVIGGMVVVIVIALIWITQLRRQVEERSLQLASEIKAREQAEYQRALEAERTRIAQDLHDELGATLTEIRFLGAVESRDELVPKTTRSQLREVSEKSHQMVSSLDEIVWAVNPANDSLPNLANYLCHVTEEFFRAAEMRCRLDVEQSLPPVALTSEVRHNLYLVVREALNNVVKHSRATEAWLRIHWKDRSLHIIVEDNGRGFVSTDKQNSGNGLSNMPRRIQKIGGVFECDSSPGRGTVCRIHLPLA